MAVQSRRAFLRYLLGSPLLAADPLRAAERLFTEVAADAPGADALIFAAADAPGADALISAAADAPGADALISAAAEAINVFDFRPVAERKLSPAHYDFLSLGVDHEVTLAANRRGFERYALRPRRLVDTRDVDLACEVAGSALQHPILLAPCGAQKAFHSDGEIPVARAARRQHALQILSMGSSVGLAEVAEARGAPLWSQLYATRFWPVTRWLLSQAESAGCSAVVLTVDIAGLGENRDRINRYRRADNPSCQGCHRGDAWLAGASRAAAAVGIEVRELISDSILLDWDFVDRIRDATSLKLLVKGILTGEDAALCVEHGVDGIVVSNHGGRAEDVGLSTIEVLPEVVAAVAGRIPVLVDSGFRRGTDVFKALALGAAAVCIGRPYLWGLAAFGQQGVEAVLGILRRELEMIMKSMGTPSLAAITKEHVRALPAAGAS